MKTASLRLSIKYIAIASAIFLLQSFASIGHSHSKNSFDITSNYTKREYRIPMRDGVKLFTAVYIPKDSSKSYPIMLKRTPYSVAPYGEDAYDGSLGPSDAFAEEGYIFAYQDVRGKYLSEGEFSNVRPQLNGKADRNDIDESTDTYDSIDWLVKNIPNNNGRVGMWGISYPGFYTAAGIINTHPALKAASPQAPIADWFIGDDFHHNGAFYLQDAFNFFSSFGLPRPSPTTVAAPKFDYGSDDAYKFFLNLGPLRNANSRYFKNNIAFWNDLLKHETYDKYWKERNLLPHLKNIKSSVMTVGGWFDAEDLYGPLNIYKTIESNNPDIKNTLVIGPWSHGGWARSEGEALGDVEFGSKTSLYYREKVELPFFNFYLKDKGTLDLPEALIFNTGADKWTSFNAWPPKNLKPSSLYLEEGGKLSFESTSNSPSKAYDEYVSDPSNPVPYTAIHGIKRPIEYMCEDQRFVTERKDSVIYTSDVLNEETTLAGPITADIFASVTGTDADFIVKLIDAFPEKADNGANGSTNAKLNGYQMLVRAEVMRAKFRNGYDNPKAMKPGEITPIKFELRDVCHTFKKGHRIMVQIQSSWFPLVDRNPQKFTDIYHASEKDFQKETHRIYRSPQYPSRLLVGVLN